MITSIAEFEKAWGYESEATAKLLRVLTNASLAQAVVSGQRTLGRMAWHLVVSIPEMAGRTGLKVEGPGEQDPVPSSASQIVEAYQRAARSLLDGIASGWSDGTLSVEDDMYGERWKRGMTLDALIRHQAHHRGQMTVLMRQAGLKVPGVYGPAQEEWAGMGMQAPEI
jgi:uncharacterized damage-inducible protein DinB